MKFLTLLFAVCLAATAAVDAQLIESQRLNRDSQGLTSAFPASVRYDLDQAAGQSAGTRRIRLRRATDREGFLSFTNAFPLFFSSNVVPVTNRISRDIEAAERINATRMNQYRLRTEIRQPRGAPSGPDPLSPSAVEKVLRGEFPP